MRVQIEGTVRIKTDDYEKYYTNCIVDVQDALIGEIGLTKGSSLKIEDVFSVKLIENYKISVSDGIFKNTIIDAHKYIASRGVRIGHGKTKKSHLFSGPSYALTFEVLDV